MSGLFEDPRVDRLIEALRRAPGWPADDAADDQFARRLIEAYPEVNLAERIEEWSMWLLDNPDVVAGTKNWRLRLHTWLREGRRHGLIRRQGPGAPRASVRGARAPQRPGGSRPGSVRSFGETRRLDDW